MASVSENASHVESDDTYSAFFYGTLMAPEVFFNVCYSTSTQDVSVIKTLHKFEPALLKGYCRRRVWSADYPGIVEDAAHDVRGVYVTGLTDANMFRLDHFEGSEYERRTVKVRKLVAANTNTNTNNNGNSNGSEKGGEKGGEGALGDSALVEGDEELECDVYVFLSPDMLEQREWDFDEFRTQKMKSWTRAEYGFEDADKFWPQEPEAAEW